jgi:threonine synthase
MKFISTRGRSPAVDFRTALFEGLAPDGGLYVPASLEPRPSASLDSLAIAHFFVGDEIPSQTLSSLLDEALNFPVPLSSLDDRLLALELFHGPTFAFKDVGARTMARLMGHFQQGSDPLTVLVATSGDTGSAVAQAFFGIEGTRVVVLFPEGQVSPVQEAQFTTLGGNVRALAVTGTFDDCQRLAKEAFSDAELRAQARLTSANSINIGRLIPQTFYFAQSARAHPHAIFSVPSGNFGNLTAGLIAWRLGAPIARFVAATTINDTLPRFLATGRYEPRPSTPTLANAMDVGNPSNVERMRWLFHGDLAAMRAAVVTSVHTDDEVRGAIRDLSREYGYVADPHSAIGYLGTRGRDASSRSIFLATAHPAKFRETVEPIIGREVPLPPALEDALKKPRHVERISPTLVALRDVLT